jgi:hypothetical protein
MASIRPTADNIELTGRSESQWTAQMYGDLFAALYEVIERVSDLGLVKRSKGNAHPDGSDSREL